MPQEDFPPLPLYAWQDTRDTLHGYVKVLGRIRRQLSPPQKHWWHTSLRVTEAGISTAAIPQPGQNTGQFEINLDLKMQRLTITTTWGVWWEMPINGQPPLIFAKQVLGALEYMNLPIEIDRSDLELLEKSFDSSSAQAYWLALESANVILNRFKKELPGQSSQVQLWPHHFDLALMWLSGRKVPGVDPNNEEQADENISFGFSTGDDEVPEPYFYATVYPWPAAIINQILPEGSSWYTASWKGGMLPYAILVDSSGPRERLLNFLRATYLAGSNSLY